MFEEAIHGVSVEYLKVWSKVVVTDTVAPTDWCVLRRVALPRNKTKILLRFRHPPSAFTDTHLKDKKLKTAVSWTTGGGAARQEFSVLVFQVTSVDVTYRWRSRLGVRLR